MARTALPRPVQKTWVVALYLLGAALASVAPAKAQKYPEGLILTVARAQDLARLALGDALIPLGALLSQIGPSSLHAGGGTGLGHFSLSLGAVATPLRVTSPDYTLVDPSGSDRIEAAAGAVLADLSVGISPGYAAGSVTGVGSLDLLIRVGLTLGDQDDLGENVDVGSLKPILGAGARLGLLQGPGVPSISVAGGVNLLVERTFRVQAESEGTPFEVSLGLEQSTAFLLLEIGKRVGFVTPYGAAGLARHNLDASYVSEVVYDPGSSPVIVQDALGIVETVPVFLAGLEVGGGPVRFIVEGGIADGEAMGSAFFRLGR